MDDHHASRPLGDQGGHLSEQAAADVAVVAAGGGGDGDHRGTHSVSFSGPDGRSSCRVLTMVRATCAGPPWPEPMRRSEEHTSELQSRGHIVCGLLLANK